MPNTHLPIHSGDSTFKPITVAGYGGHPHETSLRDHPVATGTGSVVPSDNFSTPNTLYVKKIKGGTNISVVDTNQDIVINSTATDKPTADVYAYTLSSTVPTPSSSGGKLNFNFSTGVFVGNTLTITWNIQTADGKYLQNYMQTLAVKDYIIIRKKIDPDVFVRLMINSPIDIQISAPVPAGTFNLTGVVISHGTGVFTANDALEFIISDRSLPFNTASDVENPVPPFHGDFLRYNSATSKWINNTVSINDCTDVQLSAPTFNQTLTWDGAKFINNDFPTVPTTLNDLTDVAITAVATGNILQYNGANWINIQPTPTTAIYEYTVDTTVVAPPISTARIVYDNATQTSSTVIYISHITDLAQDIENFLSLYSTGTKLTIQDKNVSGNYQNFEITGAPTVSPTAYVSFPVSFLSAGGTGTTNFGNNLKTVVVFTATSATGAATNSFREDTFLYTYHTGNPSSASAGGLVYHTVVGPYSDTLAFTFQDADGNNIKHFLNAVNTNLAKGTIWGLKKKSDVNTFVFFAVISAASSQSAPDPAGRIVLTGQTVASHGTFTVGDICELYINRVADFITSLADFETFTSDFSNNAVMVFDSATSKFKTVSRSSFFTDPQLQGTIQIGGIGTGYTLPTSDGTINQVLTTLGNGTVFFDDVLNLTTTGTTGVATLVGKTLNIPDYSSGGGGGGVSVILSAPYPIHRIGANITPATTQYYMNANANFTGTATNIRFMLGSAGSDNFRLGIYRANNAWDINTAVLIGQTAVSAATGLATDTVHSLSLVAESGQNLNLIAGECIILCCYFDGTVASWKGSTITSSTVAWQNTANLTAPALNFPTNPAAKATNSGTVPFLDLIGSI